MSALCITVTTLLPFALKGLANSFSTGGGTFCGGATPAGSAGRSARASFVVQVRWFDPLLFHV